MENIGQKIRIGRIRRNWKQCDLAKALNVSQGLISHWELNIRIPDGITLIQIAKVLNISQELFGIEKEDVKDIVCEVRTEIKEIKKEMEEIKQRMDKATIIV